MGTQWVRRVGGGAGLGAGGGDERVEGRVVRAALGGVDDVRVVLEVDGRRVPEPPEDPLRAGPLFWSLTF